jgi:hypothetical protein
MAAGLLFRSTDALMFAVSAACRANLFGEVIARTAWRAVDHK